MITYDVPRSMIAVDGVWFPAAGLICPPHDDDDDDSPRQRLLGTAGWRPSVLTPTSRGQFADVYVPLENGALAAIHGWAPDGGKVSLDLQVESQVCALSEYMEDPLWLPTQMRVAGRRITPEGPGSRPGSRLGAWWGCDEDWLAEMVQRLATMEVVQPVCRPRAQLLPLSEVAACYGEVAA